MSGTSLDGIDAVLLRVHGNAEALRFKQLAHLHQPYPTGLTFLLLRNSFPHTSRVDEIARLNFLLAELYADAVLAVVKKAGKKLSEVAYIGSHGQTIQHLPNPVKMCSKNVRATLQIGDPSALAALTGVTTVGDFRVADVALGGEGAPLVPYCDWLMFRSKTRTRVLLNIGGIANITVLPQARSVDNVVAFDTGPGNMVIDALMQRLYRGPFDRDGRVASGGMVALSLLRWMMRHPYLKRKPPKSTGREEFGAEFVNDLVWQAKGYDNKDVVATATSFTAASVFDACRRFVRHRADEVIVSGGGANNCAIVDALQDRFGDVPVRRIEEFGISSEAKEAICFALLANETMAGNAANLPGVTGAKRKVVLGKICPASE